MPTPAKRRDGPIAKPKAPAWMVRGQALSMLSEMREHRIRWEMVEENAPWYRDYYENHDSVQRAAVERALVAISKGEELTRKEERRLAGVLEMAVLNGWHSADGYIPPRHGPEVDATARKYWLYHGEPEDGEEIEPEPKPAAMARPQKIEKPASGIYRGADTRIHVPGEEPLPAYYAIYELAAVTASHDFSSGSPRSNIEAGKYPDALQPREYLDGGPEALAVVQHASPKERNANYFVSSHPSADSGPPSVTPDGIAINGNSRIMTLDYAAHKLKDFAWYRDALRDVAPAHGIPSEVIPAYKNPVLVRVVEMDPETVEARRFAGAGNVSLMQSQTPIRLAASLNRLVTDELLKSLALGDKSTFSEVVTHPTGGKSFRRHLRTVIPSTEDARFFRKDGTLTESGVELVRGILLTKIVPVEIVERLGEDRKRLKLTLEAVIPQIIRARRDRPDMDLTPQLVEALGFIVRNPEVRDLAGANDALGQLDIFGGTAEEISPGGRMLLDSLLQDGEKSAVYRARLTTLLSETNISGALFADELPPVEEAAAAALKVQVREGATFGGPMPRIDHLVKGPQSPATLRVSATADGDKLKVRIR